MDIEWSIKYDQNIFIFVVLKVYVVSQIVINSTTHVATQGVPGISCTIRTAAIINI